MAFAGCTGLKAVYSQTTVPPAISLNCFSAETKAEATLYIPTGTRQLYEATKGWDFANIVEIEMEQGIEGIEFGKMKMENVYDLQGRRLTEVPAKGMYVKDGKKYMK